MFPFATIIFYAIALQFVHAVPAMKLVERAPLPVPGEVSPHITSPTANTVWTQGSRQNVTWDTSGIPANSRGTLGLVVSGGTVVVDLLEINTPLPDGSVEVTCPTINATITGHDYVVVFVGRVVGDLGTSPKFTIQ